MTAAGPGPVAASPWHDTEVAAEEFAAAVTSRLGPRGRLARRQPEGLEAPEPAACGPPRTRRFAGLFGSAARDGSVQLASGHSPVSARLEVLSCAVPPATGGRPAGYPALTPTVPAASWYERELADMFGLVPEGNPAGPTRSSCPVTTQTAPPCPGSGGTSERWCRTSRHCRPTSRAKASSPSPTARSARACSSRSSTSSRHPARTSPTSVPVCTTNTAAPSGASKACPLRWRPAGRTGRGGGVGRPCRWPSARPSRPLRSGRDQRLGPGGSGRGAVPEGALLVRALHAELERVANHLDSMIRHTEAAGQAVANARLAWHKERV